MTEDQKQMLLLRELIRQAERSVDHQLDLIDQQDQKNTHATRTGLALLTVMVSATGLLLHIDAIHRPEVIIFMASTALVTAWTTGRLVLLSTGFRRPTSFGIGIAPRTLARIARHPAPATQRFLVSAIEKLASLWRANERQLRRLIQHRDRQILWLFSTFALSFRALLIS